MMMMTDNDDCNKDRNDYDDSDDDTAAKYSLTCAS